MSTPYLATAADLPATAALLVAFNTEYDDPAPAPEWLANHLAKLVAAGDTEVVLVGHPPVGVAVLRYATSIWSDTPECLLAELYVTPDRRGQGLGRALMQQVERLARARGSSLLQVVTGESDVAAWHLYQSQGMDCYEDHARTSRSIYYEKEL